MSHNDELKVLHEGNFIRLLRKGEWEYTQRTNCSGIVLIVPMTDDNIVVFVEQFRPPVKANTIEFPAGLCGDLSEHRQEDIQKAAHRELKEETGYQANRFEELMVSPIACGSSSDTFTILRAHGIRKVGPGGGDHSENITVHEIPLKDVDPWLTGKRRAGCMVDAKIYAGLYFLKQYNNFS